MEVNVKKLIFAVLVVAAALGALSGCAGMGGRPRGPVDAFVFATGANPGLSQNAPGVLNMSRDPLEIMVVVPPGTNLRNLVATFSLNVEAAIFSISSGAKVEQKNGVTPNDFSAPVMYNVEIPKQKKPWRYKVTVREAETNARLAQLTLGEGLVLKPSFASKVKSYSVTVPFATKKVKVDARAEGQYLKSITIDGAPSQGGGASGSVDFSSGEEKTFLIETLAEDGVSRDEYSVQIERGAPDRNANLDSLEIKDAPLIPGFSAMRKSYQVQVPFDAKAFALKTRPQSQFSTAALSAIVTTGKAQSRAALSYKGDPVDKNGSTVDFTGTDRITVVVAVTAQDGSVQEYLVDVVRAEPEHNNSLASLAVTGGRLTPGFVPAGLSYVAEVPFATKQLAVVALPQGKYAKVAFEPGPAAPQGASEIPYKGDPASKTGAIFDFSTGDRLSLAAAVTAQDGKVLRYFLDVRRMPPDSNADLSGIAVSAGILSPLFTPRMVSYTVSLPSNVETVKVTLTTASPVATVSADQPVAQSGATTVVTVPAAAGKVLTVSVIVTAEDGSQRLYRVNVSREALPVSARDGNSRLASLQVTGAALTPPFDPAIVAYDVRVPSNVESVAVNARAESPVAAVTVDGSPLAPAGRTVAVPAGAAKNVIVDVTAENGAATRYTLRAAREGSTPAQPPSGGDSVVVTARNAQLDKREAVALVDRGETIGNQARIAIRYYRTNEAISQETIPVMVRAQGGSWAISFEYRSPGVSLDRNRLIEVEVAIPTSGKDSLQYAEVQQADDNVRVDVPFFLLTDKPRAVWPAVGAPVKVVGYVSMIQPGKAAAERSADREDFEKNDKGDYGITVEITDPKSGKPYGKDTIYAKPGAPRGRTYYFSAPMSLPEGATVGYTLTARARNGKIWQVTGTTVVRTTMLDYNAGFAPVLLFLADDLTEKK
jgi:hypothetical protein